LEYPRAYVLGKQVTKVIQFDESKLLHFRRNPTHFIASTEGDLLFVHVSGDFDGCGVYLPEGIEWQIVKDHDGLTILVGVRK